MDLVRDLSGREGRLAAAAGQTLELEWFEHLSSTDQELLQFLVLTLNQIGEVPVTADGRSILKVLSRSLCLRCPACGQSSILDKPFRIKHHCPNCRALFKREEGFFVGAILANVMATEFVILLLCLVWLIVIGSSYETVLVGLFIVALLFPVAFYHHSWSLWLGFDYLVEGLPTYDKTPLNKRIQSREQ